MNIRLDFDNYEEMIDFCTRLIGIGKTVEIPEAVTRPAEPESTAPEEPTPAVEEAEPDAEEPAAEEPVYTKEDIRAKLRDLQKAGKKKEVSELIESFGVTKFTEIPQDKYNELMEKAEEL